MVPAWQNLLEILHRELDGNLPSGVLGTLGSAQVPTGTRTEAPPAPTVPPVPCVR